MIALYDFLPSFCPHCGAAITLSRFGNRGDYLDARCSFGCPTQCGVTYAYVETEKLRDTATATGSDLARYA